MRTTKLYTLGLLVAAVTAAACSEVSAPTATARVPKGPSPTIIANSNDAMYDAVDTAITCSAIGGCQPLTFLEVQEIAYWADLIIDDPLMPWDCKWAAIATLNAAESGRTIKAPNFNPSNPSHAAYGNPYAIFDVQYSVAIYTPRHFGAIWEERGRTYFHEGYHHQGFASTNSFQNQLYEATAEQVAQACAP